MTLPVSLLGLIVLVVGLVSSVTSAQPRPAPVIDMHMHASGADDQGPPPLAVCVGLAGTHVWDQRTPWADAFIKIVKNPACPDPVWSPTTEEALRAETTAAITRLNVYGVLSGTPARVARWRQDAPDRLFAGLGLQVGATKLTPDDLKALHAKGQLAVLAEVTNQYVGIAADDQRFEPYLATAEALDIPVGIHIGTGPPGAPYLFNGYRARLHSALQLEEPLIKHPKLRVYVMHAGWPMADDLLAVMWAHPQVHVEVGVIVWALPRAEFYRYLQRIVEAGFGKRVMFGSDQMVWPGVIERSIRVIEEAPFLSAAQKRDILYNNAARFLRLSDADIARHHGR
jgi:predicted TIM-barrel fold metal-dependent hydrolase